MTRITCSTTAGVATITLNDPERRNALDPELARELAETIRSRDADPDVGAIVVTGAGKGFCAGANLGSLAAAATGDTADAAALEERRRAYMSLYEPFLALRAARVPTLAAVNGAAVGAGLNLVLAADVAIAASSARFMSGFLRIGLHPGGGNTHMLTARLGPQTAAAMTLFGETLDGTAAAAHGLVLRCVADEELLPAAQELAARAAAYPAAATARCKETLRMAAHSDYETTLAAEVTAQIWTTTLPETTALLTGMRHDRDPRRRP